MPARRNTRWTSFLLFCNLLIITATIVDLVRLLLHPGLVFLLWFLLAAGEGIEGPAGFVLLLCCPRRRRRLRRRVRRMRSRLSVGTINFPDAVVLIDSKATLMVAILEQLLQVVDAVDAQVRVLILHGCHAVFHRSPALSINIYLPVAVLQDESQQTSALLILASPLASLQSPGLGLHVLLGLRSRCRLLPLFLLTRSSRSISATLKPPPRRRCGSCGLPIVRLA
mmetsp:Transcript_94275/g.130944  ORF Transcript_94275/g.130944 Transcript_94275/m.130944 type:complete len:225 (-) Transcript_94275:93-767(-)